MHTSQGDNMKRISLKAFIAYRCGCPFIDEDLLKRVAEEEVRELSIISDKIEQDRLERAQMIRSTSRAEIQRIRINLVTFWFGFLSLFLSLLCVGYYDLSAYILMDDFAKKLLLKHLDFSFYGYVVSVAGSLLTILHGKVATTSLCWQIPLFFLRFFACAALVTLCTMGGIELYKAMGMKNIDDFWHTYNCAECHCSVYRTLICYQYDSLPDYSSARAAALRQAKDGCDAVEYPFYLDTTVGIPSCKERLRLRTNSGLPFFVCSVSLVVLSVMNIALLLVMMVWMFRLS